MAYSLSGIRTKKKAQEIVARARRTRRDWTWQIVSVEGPPKSWTVIGTPPAAVAVPDSLAAASGPDAKIRRFLDFIGRVESTGNYNAKYGAASNTNDPEFTGLSVDEVLVWQSDVKLDAAGKYQIIEKTLKGLKEALGLTGSELFDPAMQDRMAVALLERRGLSKYRSGTLSAEDFANSVAKEWAAFPVVSGQNKGKSYYDGDGINSALVEVDAYMAEIVALK